MTVAEAVLRSSVAGVTVTVAVRLPRCVVIEVGPSLCSTVATWSRRMRPAPDAIGSAFSSSIVFGTDAACRYTVRVVPSISTVPACRGCIVFDTRAPTATSDSPSEAALVRSTETATYGSDADRFEVTWPMPALPSRPATTASVAVCSASAEGAVTSTSMSLEANPPCPEATVTVPTSSRSASASCTFSRTATWSALASVVIE